MTTANKELYGILKGIDIAAADPAVREKNKKLLVHLCGDQYQQNTPQRLDRFKETVDKKQLPGFTLNGTFQQTLAPTPAPAPVAAAPASTSTVAATPAPVAFPIGESPEELFELARHKLLTINVYDRIQRHRSDATIDQKDEAFLTNIGGNLPQAFKEFGFDGLNIALIGRDLSKLKDSAKKKCDDIKGARTKVESQLGDLKTKTEALINQLSADDKTPNSMAQFVKNIEDSNFNDKFTHAIGEIEQRIQENLKQKETHWRDLKKRKQLKEEREGLNETKRMLIAVKAIITERQQRMLHRQAQLSELQDALCLRNIQCGNTEYQVQKGFPPNDQPLKVGVVYYEDQKDPAGAVVTGYLVKFRDIGKDNATEVPYSIADMPNMSDAALLTKLRTEKKILVKGDQYQLNANLAGLQAIHDWAEDIDQDKQECQQLLKTCLEVAEKPEETKHKQPRANFFLRIYSKHNKDPQKPHIVEEIINQDSKVDAKSPKHGLEGERIVARGIFLDKKQTKRTTCKTSNGDIVIETRVLQKESKEVVSVVNKTPNWSSLKQEDKQTAALLFATDLLIKAKPGDYIRLSGKESDAEQATMVYAALLLLTMPEPNEKQEDALRFNISRIKVNVPGVKLPSIRELHLNWDQSWRNTYTQSVAPHADVGFYKRTVEETRKKMASPEDESGGPRVESEVHVYRK